ncbi:MAG: isocitrate dehydrogenase (NADP(+)) [Desulfarculaceae bacterium]|nr:isocitrate dehydrogenase (NADP(+)) [Desulfarculaceae bacterium]
MGETIEIRPDGSISVPDHPVIPFIKGDGTGPDIWHAARMVLDKAVETAYDGSRKIDFMEVSAGEESFRATGEWLPAATLETINRYRVAIKGPLATPVGGGIRSLNVAIRHALDLFACIRPVKYMRGVPSPFSEVEKIDMVIFRENTEDLYKGIEWEAGSEDALKALSFIRETTGIKLDETTAVGIKPISSVNTKRLMKKALEYAVANRRKSVTVMHKGNIMKYTEGGFVKWAYQAAEEMFKQQTVTEEELYSVHGGSVPEEKLVVKDRIADNMFQQVVLRPDEYDVIAAPNLNGDYMSDLLAAMTGGLGLAPGANVGEKCAVFEATHGTAPKYAGKDKVNPGSLILSGAMMLDHIGWEEAGNMVRQALEATISEKKVTYDLARKIPGASTLKCSEFGRAVCERMNK